MAAAVWVYRHAQSLSNAGEKTADPAAIPLTQLGREQAAALAQTIVSAPNRTLVSPFLRAVETAAPLLVRYPLAGCATWAIQEFTYLEPSSCIGTSWVERKPRIDAYWTRLDPRFRDGPGAESFVDLMERARAFLADVGPLEERLTIAVSHGQFMRAAQILAESPDLDPDQAMRVFAQRQAVRAFANCERLVLRVVGGRVRVETPGR